MQGQVHVAASPPAVWEAVTDLAGLAACSPELVEARWQQPAVGPAVGARFIGRNARGPHSWETTCTVTEATPPRVFAYTVGDPADPVAVWRYQLLAGRDGGTWLTEAVQLGTADSPLLAAIEAEPQREQEIVAGRLAQLHSGIEHTLRELAVRAETAVGSDPASLRRLAAALHDHVGDDTGPDGVRRVLAGLAKGGALQLGWLCRGTYSDRDVKRAVTVIEALAAGSATVAQIALINAVLGPALIAMLATPAQRAALLPPLSAGHAQVAFALTEPDAGSDARALTTTITRRGDRILLHGVKTLTTGAATADHLLVVARLADDPGFRVVAVPRDNGGVHVQALPKLGGNAHASCRVDLNDALLSVDGILGGPHAADAWPTLRRLGGLERLCVAALCVGVATDAIDAARAAALTREQFGRPVAGFQAVRHALVDLDTTLHAMTGLVDRAVSALDHGEPTAGVLASRAKLFCADHLQHIVTRAMALTGGQAYLAGHRLSRLHREAPWALYAGGTAEIQRDIVARELLPSAPTHNP